MHTEHIHQIGIGIVLLFVFANAQDSLIYPEALSPRALEEFENEGKVAFRISFTETIKYRIKTQFTYRGFELYYLNQGGEKEAKQTTSLTYSSKWINIGFGRGQPHIAKGLILGNTMMRFTPNLRNNAGIRRTKLRISNYDHYDELIFLYSQIGKIYVSAFRYDGVLCGLGEYHSENYFAGMAFYGLEKPLLETWFNFKNDRIRTSADFSLTEVGINHLCGDALYKYEKLTLFSSLIYLHPDFRSLKTDSKWGSGLKPGSWAYAVGASLSRSHWKMSMIGSSILRDKYSEKRFMSVLRFKKKPFEINLSYALKELFDLKENDHFPFELVWQKEQFHLCKMNLKLQLNKMLQLSCQLQGDISHSQSYAAILRLTYKASSNLLRIQISRSRGIHSDLYFLRPLSTSTYSIRRSPKEETIYMDLVYSKDIGIMKIYVLLRNEGANMGFTIDN